MSTRIYEVKATITMTTKGREATEEHVYLVEAGSRRNAERHVGKKYVGDAEIAAPKRIAELMGNGTKLETATEKDD